MFFDALAGNWEWVRPEEVGALTDAPMLMEDARRDDDGNLMPHVGDMVYAHMNYTVEDPIETWSKGGVVYFQGSPFEDHEVRPKKLLPRGR
jgi:hypothetical protein